MAGKIAFIIIVLIAGGGLLYIARSGVIGSTIQALHIVPLYHATNTGGTGSSISSGSGTGSSQIDSGNQTTTRTIDPRDIPAGFTASQLSPNFRKVRINGASYGSYYSYGTITLSGYSIPASTTINITGWNIKAKHGGEYIPQAINVYEPSGLTPATDIILKPNDNVYLYSSPGPFNIRINKCIGYIALNNRLTPSLPSNCPYLDRSQIQNFTGACQNYVQSISSCSSPNLNDPRIPFNDFACRNFIANHFSYYSCFNDHSTDADFLSSQVWVWTGSNVIDQYHDQIQLLDRNGLVVDVYSY